MNVTHVTSDLSAYLDQELAPAEQARVSAHLEACQVCSARLAELRATATLIAALPAARPARSLVPSTAPRWNWLRPVRSLSAVASGAFVMVFLITAVAQSGSDLGGGPTSPFTRSAPGAAQPASATEAPDAAPAAPQRGLAAATPSAAPAALGAAGSAPAATTATPTSESAFAVATGQTEDAAKRAAQDAQRDTTTQSYGLESSAPSPLIWLGLALLLAMVAAFAHWRLRAA